jgi:hypothetical protein
MSGARGIGSQVALHVAFIMTRRIAAPLRANLTARFHS